MEEGFDLALRIGHLSDSSLVARQLATIRVELCASPAYLARKGRPEKPEDLKQHDCLIYTLTQPEWHFKRGSEQQSIRPQGPLRANNGVALTRAACDDQGIILQPTFIVGEALRSGQLVSLLPEWDKGDVGLYAVYPHRRFVSAKVRCFIEFVQERYLAPQQWDAPT